MLDLKACTVCFSTNVNLYNMDSGTLRHEYNLISGLKTTDCCGLPKYLCVECSAYIKRFVKFRKKCQRAHFTLRELQVRSKEISMHKLEAIDRKRLDLKPELSFIDINRTNYEEAYCQWAKTSRLGLYYGDIIPIIHHSTHTTKVIDMPKKLETESQHVKVEEDEPVAPSLEHQDLEQFILIVKDADDTDYFDNDHNISDHSEEPPPVKKPKLKGKSAKKLEPNGSSLDQVLAKKRISTVWTVKEDKKLLQLMANEECLPNYSSVTKHFPDKTRVHLRTRYITLLKWMRRHPNTSLDSAPRRGARRLGHGFATDNLNKATDLKSG